MLDAKTFRLELSVRVVGDGGAKVPLKSQGVQLEAFAGEARVKSYTATTDEQGVAVFEPLTAIPGVRYVPTVTHEGVSSSGAAILPDEDVEKAEMSVFRKTYDDKGLLVTDLMTTVDLWEGFLVFSQTWSLVNTGGAAFDPNGNPNPAYKDGLVLRVPKTAQGVQAQIIKRRGDVSDARVLQEKVLVQESIPPQLPGQDPMRVQIRYSIPLESKNFEYEQPLDFKVESMRVIVATTTQFEKVPRLSLTLDAPGFGEVGPSSLPNMKAGQEFLVARDGKGEPGGTLRFGISGYPVPDPIGAWAAFGAAFLILVGGVWLYRQEVARLEGGSARKVLLRALEQEREELFEDLRDLEESYDQGEVSDRRYDVEAAELRERLALVLRRLAHEERQDAA
jgi:hypothetical protein